MKLIIVVLAGLTLSGCSLTKPVWGTLPGENFSREGSCGTVNVHGEVKQWGCLVKK